MSVPAPAFSNDPAPVIAPENVVLLSLRPAIRVEPLPMTTEPAPASEPTPGVMPPAAICSAAPALTVRAEKADNAPLEPARSVPATMLVAPV
jgi:hypothetical protein